MFRQKNMDWGDSDTISEEVQNTEYVEESVIEEPLSCATGTIEYVKIGELSPIKKETTSYYLLTNMGEYPIHSFERSTFSSVFDVSLNSYQEDFYWNLANGQNYIFYISQEEQGLFYVYNKVDRTVFEKRVEGVEISSINGDAMGDNLLIDINVGSPEFESYTKKYLLYSPMSDTFTEMTNVGDLGGNSVRYYLKTISSTEALFAVIELSNGYIPKQRIYKYNIEDNSLREMSIGSHSPYVNYIQDYGSNMVFSTFTYIDENSNPSTYRFDNIVIYDPITEQIVKEFTIPLEITDHYYVEKDSMLEGVFIVTGEEDYNCYFMDIANGEVSEYQENCMMHHPGELFLARVREGNTRYLEQYKTNFSDYLIEKKETILFDEMGKSVSIDAGQWDIEYNDGRTVKSNLTLSEEIEKLLGADESELQQFHGIYSTEQSCQDTVVFKYVDTDTYYGYVDISDWSIYLDKNILEK